MKIPYKTIITDVDGVLTDGSFLYSKDGKEYKKFGPHDSDGIKLLKTFGVTTIAITADKRGYPITKARLDDMKVELFIVSENERFNWIETNYGFDNIGFVGDGLYDAACLTAAYDGFAPSNAPHFVKTHANVQLIASGGNGVFLEIALWILNQYGDETDVLNTLNSIGLKYERIKNV